MAKKRVRSSKRKATKKKATKKKSVKKRSVKKKASKRKPVRKASKKKTTKKKAAKRKPTKKRVAKKKSTKKKATKKKSTKKKAAKKKTSKKKTTKRKASRVVKRKTKAPIVKEKTIVVERPETKEEPIPHIENIDIQPLFEASKEYDSEIKGSAEAVVSEEQKRAVNDDDPVSHELHGSVHQQKPNEVTVYNENRLSGTAVTAFVFAFLIPPVGIILGLIAKQLIAKNPRLRGDRLALAAFLIGLIFSIVWAISLFLLY